MDNAPAFGDADLTNCDREPIHIPGSIQPFGVLVAFDPASLEVVQVAGRVEELLGIDGSSLLGEKLLSLIGPAAMVRLQSQFGPDFGLPRQYLSLELEALGRPLDAVAHLHDGLVILEMEPQRGPADDVIDSVHHMVASLQPADSVEKLLEALARQVQAITGYDRVMVYRFREDASGHVVAEQRSSPDVPSFLDLHYPASDIPVQARALYLTNWMRYIPDVDYQPQPLLPSLNPKTGLPLDLSFSRLRSVSPLHLEYLGNMGVRSSMSLSLIVGGKLWGLIACHAAHPVHLGSRLRLGLELFAQLASLHLRSTIDLVQANERIKVRDIHEQLTRAITREGLPEALIERRPNLLDFVQADGVVIHIEGENFALGITPANAQVNDLVAWLNETQAEGVFASDRLAELYPPAADMQKAAAGLMALSVSRSPRDYVLWFRREVVSTVTWAGNPEKPVEISAEGERLRPRASFEAWQETVAQRSWPWRDIETEAATLLRTTVLEVVLNRVDLALREQERIRAHHELLMGELDHRCKNTIATIQSMVRVSSKHAANLIEFTRGVERRLQSMAQAHSLLSASRWESASVRKIVQDEFAAQYSSKDGNIEIVGPDYLIEARTALSFALVLHELVTNAVKYGSLSTPAGRVDFSWRKLERAGKPWLSFEWVESGGPAVVKPKRRGFGRTLLERVFSSDVNGEVVLAFEPEGVRCNILVPFQKVTGIADNPAAGMQERPAPVLDERLGGELSGARILVVEDDPMIAIDVVDTLEDAGAIVIGPFSRLAQGLSAAVEHEFHVALLDVNLFGHPSWPLAKLLVDRGIPVVLSTGYSDTFERPAQLSRLPLVSKPYQTPLLLAQLKAAMRHA